MIIYQLTNDAMQIMNAEMIKNIYKDNDKTTTITTTNIILGSLFC